MTEKLLFKAKFEDLVESAKNGTPLPELVKDMQPHSTGGGYYAYAVFDSEGNHILVTDNEDNLPTDSNNLLIALYDEDGEVDSWSTNQNYSPEY